MNRTQCYFPFNVGLVICGRIISSACDALKMFDDAKVYKK